MKHLFSFNLGSMVQEFRICFLGLSYYISIPNESESAVFCRYEAIIFMIAE